MRIVHLADTHLGFRQFHHVNDAGRNEREQDVYDAFESAIDKIVALGPAAVIHAGDFFDSHHPSNAALGVALDGLGRLRAEGISVLIIAGNHSTPRVASTDHVFEILERFGGADFVHGEPRIVRLGPNGELAVHAIPHDNDPERLAAALQAARPDPDARFNILVAHIGVVELGHVVGAEAGAVSLPGEVLNEAADFDYVALGHLHKLAPVRDNAAYAGSLARLSWADDAALKGVVEVDLAADRSSADYLRPHPIPGRHHLRLVPVDAAAIDSSLSDAIIERSEGHDIDGAMVQLAVINVTAAEWNAVDRRAIAATYASCLHFACEPHYVGESGSSTEASPQLRDFLREWLVAQGSRTDPTDFIARAETFLGMADQELTA